MTGIREFLTARLDEDEHLARHVTFNSKGRDRWQVGTVTYREDYAFASIHTPDGLEIAGAGLDGTGGVHGEVFAAHIARWDPARVLAEIAAKRAILAAIEAADATWATAQQRADGPVSFDLGRARSLEKELAEKVLRQLAAPYSDHPDFQQAWSVR